MKRGLAFGAAAALVAVLATVVLWPRRANVLLITIDTLRADRLQCYGYAKGQTPNIDRLASEGALFKNAFCDVTWTVPSLASTMTGTYATVHGLKSTYQRLEDRNRTLAEVLKEHGYATAAVVGSFPASSSFGFGQGFDFYDEEFNTPIVRGGDAEGARVPMEFHEDIEEQRDFQYRKAQGDAYRPDSEVTDHALAWLRSHHGKPFFLWAHYFGPHEKSDQAFSFFEQVNRSNAAYDGDVTASDVAVGRLIDGLRSMGLLDRTIVVLHADHGQSLNEHHYFGHGRYLYDEVLRIPLVVRYPKEVPPGTRLDAMARNIDVLPTVLAALGMHDREDFQGRNLLPLMQPGGHSHDAETYCETYLSATEGFADQVPLNGSFKPVGFRRLGVRTPEWMFIKNEPWPLLDVSQPPPLDESLRTKLTSEELYDLRADPREAANVITREPEVANQMRSRLLSYLALERQPARRVELDERSRERLRSLGYMQ